MKKTILVNLLFIFCSFALLAQKPIKPNTSEIHQAIKKLNFLGTALYIAAHPDDENTSLISYFSNDLHARTAYLSLTRGDGGQNLIGPEIRELLGVIRTNELVQARMVDGGEQFFTRANDFGFSKHPKETLNIWDKEEVLKDVVKIIRQFRPDVIVNRFDANRAGKTHGHHTTSALLSVEAFDLVGNPDYKVANTSPWQVKRQFYNLSRWRYRTQADLDKVDKSNMIKVDVGAYYPGKGLSNTEIASLSRSKHQSQGFGSTGSRGEFFEYLDLINGDMPQSTIFDGINTTWSRVKGGEAIGLILNRVENEFDFNKPENSITDLLKALELIRELEDEYWRNYKTKQIKDIIIACSGVFLEAKSVAQSAIGGEKVKLEIEGINRSSKKVKLNSVTINSNLIEVNEELIYNQSLRRSESLVVEYDVNFSSPYWLNDKAGLGMYHVENQDLIGLPLNPVQHSVIFNLNIEGVEFVINKEVIFKYTDPVKGEVYQPFEILPKFTSKIGSKVIVFNDDAPKEIPVTVTSHSQHTEGELVLKVPNNWQVSPSTIPFKLKEKGEEFTASFVVVPPNAKSEGILYSSVLEGDSIFDKEHIRIDYDHIPYQSVLQKSAAKVARLDLKTKSKRIAYIQGAGDDIPQSLQQIGYQVVEISPSDINKRELSQYDAVIVGIRAYNTLEDLRFKQDILLDYVHRGGNMIVQYNTNHRLKINGNLAPYSLKLSRDRVTDETSKVKFVNPNHAILNYPNIIDLQDFDGWVQERGLYFPNEWAPEFEAILSMNDKGESVKKGSLLVASYGKGKYIYTGLSFFRELPAGVPGAYKLFVNLIEAGKEEHNQIKN